MDLNKFAWNITVKLFYNIQSAKNNAIENLEVVANTEDPTLDNAMDTSCLAMLKEL